MELERKPVKLKMFSSVVMGSKFRLLRSTQLQKPEENDQNICLSKSLVF